jgi:Amt family ammonium transporter
LLIRTEIDDPLDFTQVHGLCGFWAIISRGIFDMDYGMLRTGETKFIGIQLLGGFVIGMWSAILSFIFFSTIKN